MAAQRGNGTGGGNVVVTQITDDWIVARTVPREPDPSRIPSLLINALVLWLGGAKTCRVGAALGIVTEGYTTEIHLWYDETDIPFPEPQSLWIRDGIAVEQLLTGCVVVKAAAPTPGQAVSPERLVAALHEWLRERPTLQVTATLGIEQASETTAFLVWFELVDIPED